MHWYHMLVAIGAVFSALGAYVIGWQFGRQHGQHEQWVHDVIAAARRDEHRRLLSKPGSN